MNLIVRKQTSQSKKDGGLALINNGKTYLCHTMILKYIAKFKRTIKRQEFTIQ